MRIVEHAAREVVDTPPPEPGCAALAGTDRVGALLRDARERRGLSVEGLAQITRIRASVLRAIESDALDALPPSIFLRGFLRAYAREVGLDPEETVRGYLRQFEAAAPTVENPTDRVENADTRVEPDVNWRALRNVGGLLVLAGIVIAYGIAVSRSQPSAPPASAASARPAPESRPEIGTGGSTSPVPVASAGHVLHLALRTKGDCWVSAKVDGAQLVYKLLAAGEQRAFDVKDEAVLHFGDPAAVTLSIDGAASRPLGAAGVPVTLHITKDNFREYLTR